MVPDFFLVGRCPRRAGGLFLPNEFSPVAKIIVYLNKKAHFVPPGQPNPEVAAKAVVDLGAEKPAVDPGAEKPIFCRVGECLYWHTDMNQVKRHRDSHFQYRYGFLCPNKTDTCPSIGSTFRRRDAVSAHCKRFPVCGNFLEANGGLIQSWGTPATEDDLQPYDPDFHKPYKAFDGQTRKGGLEEELRPYDPNPYKPYEMADGWTHRGGLETTTRDVSFRR